MFLAQYVLGKLSKILNAYPMNLVVRSMAAAAAAQLLFGIHLPILVFAILIGTIISWKTTWRFQIVVIITLIIPALLLSLQTDGQIAIFLSSVSFALLWCNLLSTVNIYERKYERLVNILDILHVGILIAYMLKLGQMIV